MNYRMSGIKVVGLCLMAAVASMAFASASAQALGNWRIEGANINATKEIESEKDSNGFKLVIAALNLETFCENFSLDDGLIFAGVKAGEGLGELLFTTCKVNQWDPLTAIGCTMANVTTQVRFKLVLHKSNNYIYIEPDGGTEFTKLKFSGEECAIAGEYPLTGVIVFNDGLSGDLATELIKHLIEPDTTAFLGQNENGLILPLYELSVSKNPAELFGSAWLKLKAPNNNKNWSGLV